MSVIKTKTTRKSSDASISMRHKEISLKKSSAKKEGSPASLLIEIGVEELPVSYIEPAAKEFLSLVIKLLDENKIPHKGGCYYHTPRRLVVFIKDVHPSAPDREEEFVGPPVAAGRTIKDGRTQYLPPSIGFASKFGLKPEELKIKNTPKGEYFCVNLTIPGVKTSKILSSEIPVIIPQIKFPKTMVWEPSKVRFARPIRNLLILYGSKAIVSQEIAGITSDRFKKTFGLGPGFSKKITIPSADKYKDTLKDNACVIVDHKERARRLVLALESAAKRSGGILVESLPPDEKDTKNVSHKPLSLENQTLFDEVNSLVEYPVCVIGGFDAKYLELPEEILITCMKKKQKFFALRDASCDGKIINKFIAVKNGISSNLEAISSNYEKVLVARLEDALFFYKNDLKKSPDELVEKLKGVVFHEKIGSMFEKTERVVRLVEKLSTDAGIHQGGQSFSDIKRGAWLSKFDLTTEMVFEYPELSGIAGSIYARGKGESETVSKIIKEHYMPIYADGDLPSSVESALVAVADKADTIASDFSVGIIPSGSEDPFGLRRAAAGILKILESGLLSVPLRRIFASAVEVVYQKDNKNFTQTANETLDKIMEFVAARLEAMAVSREDGSFSVDEVRAAMGGGFDDIRDFFVRLKALRDVKSEENFESILISVKRAANIIRQAKDEGLSSSVLSDGEDVDTSLFTDEEETKLHQNIKEVERKFEEARKVRDYLAALRLLVGLSQPLEDFFKKVMVMTPDEKLKLNRLRLLGRIVSLYSPVADFSKLVPPGK